MPTQAVNQAEVQASKVAPARLDDELFFLGTDRDSVLVHRTSVLGANTALTGVLDGIPVSPALAANSLIIANRAVDGDILLAVNVGGNSERGIHISGATGRVTLHDLLTLEHDLNIDGGDLLSTATTFNLLNATVTTLNIGGAATTITVGAAASATTWTGQSWTLTGANSTNNTTLTVTNTSNAAAASHSIVDIRVGGTTSTGDPQLRLTVPIGTSWYVGVDNSAADSLLIGVGTTVGTTAVITLDPTTSAAQARAAMAISPQSVAVADGAASYYQGVLLQSYTITLAGTTQVTAPFTAFVQNGITIAQSGGAVTVDYAVGISSIAPRVTTSVTLTESSAFRVFDASASTGTLTRQVGLLIPALTRGTTNPQILLYNGSTEHTAAVTDSCSISCIDISAGNASFSFTSEIAVASESPTPDRTWTVRINGASYKINLTAI